MRSTKQLIEDVIKPNLLEMTEPTFEQVWDDMIETFEKAFYIFKTEAPHKLVDADGIEIYYYCNDRFFLRSNNVYLTASDINSIGERTFSRKAQLNNKNVPKYLGNIENFKIFYKRFLAAISKDTHLTIDYKDFSNMNKPEFTVRLILNH